MPNRTSLTGSELFIVDNSDTDSKVLISYETKIGMGSELIN